MGWIRYHDLVRYVKINPNLKEEDIFNVLKPIQEKGFITKSPNAHYFQQPELKSSILKNGSTAIIQNNVGGLRFVDLVDAEKSVQEAWQLGFNWIDYITSWNDRKITELEKNNWKLDFETNVPWRLNPVEENYFCDITFLSEKPLPSNFVVHRSYSDHGRIGSIILTDE